MKHIIQQFLFSIFLVSSITIYGQTDSLETETAFMNCFYEALPDKGVKFKLVLKKAEQKLIDAKFLQNGNGESYVELYKNLENAYSDDLQDLGVVRYMEEVSEIINAASNGECMENVFNSSKFQDSKLSKFIQLTQSFRGSNDGASDLVNKIFSIIDAKDFEHEYYKMTTFTMIEAMNYVEFDRSLPEETKQQEMTSEEVARALKIEVQPEEVVMINDKKVALENVQKTIKEYLQKYTSEAIIAVKTNPDTSYGFYIQVQNIMVSAYDELRDELAKEKFNRSFDVLMPAQQKEIEKVYPMKIRDMK
jgi:biopolymer transport protein ExbD